MIISNSDEEGIQHTKEWLKSRLYIKDLGLLQYFLGIEAVRNKHGSYLSQPKYVNDMFKEIGLHEAKSAATTLEVGIKPLPDDSALLEDVGRYRRLVGKLIYLTVTKPDPLLQLVL